MSLFYPGQVGQMLHCFGPPMDTNFGNHGWTRTGTDFGNHEWTPMDTNFGNHGWTRMDTDLIEDYEGTSNPEEELRNTRNTRKLRLYPDFSTQRSE
jgi:hypothetical protein